jgi:succinate dehydrogenase hydrophobic anchor subunit
VKLAIAIMVRKTVLLLIWLGFVAYTLWLAPLDRPDTWPLVQKLLTLQWGKVNAFIPALFSLMGVWPMIYACLMFADGRMQNFRAWPYFLGSNGTGVICLMPYLILRKSNQEFYGQKDKWLRSLDRRSTGVALLLSTIGFLAYAAIAGNWGDYVQQFQTRAFVHLISIDFCLMCLIFPLTSLFDDDMARRGLKDSRIFWAVALVPLFGPLVYLCLRPPLPESSSKKLETRDFASLTS